MLLTAAAERPGPRPGEIAPSEGRRTGPWPLGGGRGSREERAPEQRRHVGHDVPGARGIRAHRNDASALRDRYRVVGSGRPAAARPVRVRGCRRELRGVGARQRSSRRTRFRRSTWSHRRRPSGRRASPIRRTRAGRATTADPTSARTARCPGRAARAPYRATGDREARTRRGRGLDSRAPGRRSLARGRGRRGARSARGGIRRTTGPRKSRSTTSNPQRRPDRRGAAATGGRRRQGRSPDPRSREHRHRQEELTRHAEELLTFHGRASSLDPRRTAGPGPATRGVRIAIGPRSQVMPPRSPCF